MSNKIECPACDGSGRKHVPHRHHLKCDREFFQAILDRRKRFEIRKDDCYPKFQVGDQLYLQEWDPAEARYTGRALYVKVTYKTHFAQVDGYCVMGIEHL